ncbi:MAG: DUF6517 family protein [Haloarculaceae archaeon]
MRRALALLVVLVVLTAGCSGGGSDGGDGPIVASASPATIDEAVLAETGYERVLATNETHNTSFTLTIQGDVQANPTFEVRATVHRAVYRRSLDGGSATVALLSVPTVKPSEQLASRIDPFRARTPAETAANATGADVSGLRHRDNRTVTVLGNETTMRLFDGTVARDGAAVDATVGVATVRDGTDAVTVVVVTPRGADERAAVDRLLAGVRH